MLKKHFKWHSALDGARVADIITASNAQLNVRTRAMTRAEVGNSINEIIQQAVNQSGGDWKRSYRPFVEQIFLTMGKLAPEPTVKLEAPEYDPKKVKRVGTLVQRSQFTQEQRDAAVTALRAVGLL
jgi:hypothetical protein